MTGAQPPRPRVRRSFRRAAIAAVVLLLPLSIHALWDYVEARRLSHVVEDIRRSGEPVHLGRIGEGRPKTPEQTRASRYYGAAAVLTADAHREAGFTRAVELIEEMSGAAGPIPAGDPRLAELQSLSEAYAPAFDLLDRAASLDANGLDYASEPRYGLMEHNLANANALRVARLALSGEGDGAATALVATLRVRRVVNDRLMLRVPVRTAGSVRMLATFSTASEASLLALQQAYAERDAENVVEKNLLAGRAVMIEGLWPGAQGELASLPRVQNRRPPPDLFNGLTDVILRPWQTRRFRRMLGVYAEAIEASRRAWPDRLDAAKALEERYPLRREPFGTRSRFGLAPGRFEHGPAADLARLTRQAAIILAQNRVCATVLAVERSRLAHGEAPADLEALVPAFLPAVPRDPYTGGPLRYARTITGYMVYSDGANRRDDGGDLGDARSDVSPARREPANDLGIAIRVRRDRR